MDFSKPLCYSDFKRVVRTAKEQLRTQILRKLSQQPENSRLSASLQIGRAISRLALYRKARKILCYVAIDSEVETRPLLKKALADGKRVFVPALRRKSHRIVAAEIDETHLEWTHKGPFGIPQPKSAHRRAMSLDQLDLVIVPGIAFDHKGRRLGRGGGYFDRFLTQVPLEVPRIGLAFRFQRVKELPIESHDQPMTKVITN